MKILVTGTEGYLGCLLGAELLRDGHDVVGVDTGFYKAGWLYGGLDRDAVHQGQGHSPPGRRRPRRLRRRRAHGRALERPARPARPRRSPTRSITRARCAWRGWPRQAGVERFVYMSSCSVYGVADGVVDETTPVNPQTAYAECKVLVERDVRALADDRFSPTFLRNATAYGASPRMRFDIVLNNLAGLAWTTEEISMTSDGTPWRPLVHVLDIAKADQVRAGRAARRRPQRGLQRRSTRAELPGAGHRRDRRRDVRRLHGQLRSQARRQPQLPRQLRQDHAELPGFACEWNAQHGAHQLHEVFSRIEMDARRSPAAATPA